MQSSKMSTTSNKTNDPETSPVKTFVKRAKSPPVIPTVAISVMKMMNNPNTRVDDLVKVIAQDSALVLRLLSTANSAMYASTRKIEALRDAVVLLGFGTTRQVVAAASVKEVYDRFDLADLHIWQHSLAVGLISRHIADALRFSAEEAFVAGLLHDLGKVLMRVEDKQNYNKILLKTAMKTDKFYVAEQAIFGFDHAQVTHELLEKSQLPSSIVIAVGAHHLSDREHLAPEVARLATIVELADRIAISEGVSSLGMLGGEFDPFDCPAATTLAIEQPQKIIDKFWESFEESQKIFA